MHRSGRARIGVAALLTLWATGARGQDAPTVPGLSAADWLGDALVEEASPVTRWTPVGPRAPVADVATGAAGALVIVGWTGEVWTSTGAGWRSVLAPTRSVLGETSPDERVLLELEARFDELLDRADDPPQRVEPLGWPASALDRATLAADRAEAEEEALREAAEELRHEVHGHRWFLEEDPGAISEAPPRLAVTDGRWVVGRSDGLWFSRDEGQSWERALRDRRVTGIAQDGDAWLVGTAEGLFRSDDLRDWRRVGRSDEPVLAVAASDGVVWVGATDGLWRHDRGTVRIVGVEGPARALLADASGAWVATDDGVLRVDATGARGPEIPVAGVREIARIGQETVAVGSSGVWVLGDDGSWERRGPILPSGTGVAELDGELVVATRRGLERGSSESTAPAEASLPVGLLVEASVGRRELVEGVSGRWATVLLPQLTVEGQLAPLDRAMYDPWRGTRRRLGSAWHVAAVLRWSPPRHRAHRRPIAMVDPEELGGIEILDGTAPMVAEALLRTKAVRYRSELAAEVAGLHAAHGALLGRAGGLEGAPVREQVLHALAIQELEARLDALTDGAVSRWRRAGG